MGAELIVGILQRYPDRVPDHVVVQPNNQPALVRRWGWQNGFHLCDDVTVPGRQRFVVLSFRRATAPRTASTESVASAEPFADPAYTGLDLEMAFTFGPAAVRNPVPEFTRRLRDELTYFEKLPQLGPAAARRVEMIKAILNRAAPTKQSTKPS